MDREANIPPPRLQESPPDPAYVYTSPLERFAGAAVDVIFLHIILIPLKAPAADWSFESGTIGPAAAFLALYFGFLLLILKFRGLTPGGVPMKFRIVDFHMARLSWGSAIRRLAPYIVIQLIGLWRLQVVLTQFGASGETYVFQEMHEIIKTHGGFWNTIVFALNGFVLIDLLFVIQSPRNQSLSDKIASSYAVSRSS